LPEISIVIPAFNEEKRLTATLTSVYDFFTIKNSQFEIIVVNDGSSDGTADLVDKFSQNYPQIKLISYPDNKGKGFAIKTGVLSAQGTVILIDDADGSSPIEEYQRLKTAIDDGAAIAIGSRAKPDPNCNVKALPYRTYIGNTFNSIVQSLLLPGIHDTQCGFKLFKKEIAHEIFSDATIDGYAFDVEILYLARQREYKIDEISINWHNAAGSKVNIWIDSFKMLFQVLKISWRAFQGKYRKEKLRQVDE
jgi:dolichyl-phosphate beta-glucosyltransferase